MVFYLGFCKVFPHKSVFCMVWILVYLHIAVQHGIKTYEPCFILQKSSFCIVHAWLAIHPSFLHRQLYNHYAQPTAHPLCITRRMPIVHYPLPALCAPPVVPCALPTACALPPRPHHHPLYAFRPATCVLSPTLCAESKYRVRKTQQETRKKLYKTTFKSYQESYVNMGLKSP